MTRNLILTAVSAMLLGLSAFAQEVPIAAYSIDGNGNVEIQVASTAANYYILEIRHSPDGDFSQAVSMTMGEDGTTTLTESLAAYPEEHYRVLQYAVANPVDTDGDGTDDVTEFNDLGTHSPINAAPAIGVTDGVVSIPDRDLFEQLSYKGSDVLRDTHLSDLEFVKFYILEANTDNPYVYFMNTVTHRAHNRFATALGLGGGGRGGIANSMRGEIVYHPGVLAPNGKTGHYRYEFEPNDNYPFEEVQWATELIAANMPLLENDFSYYPMPNAALPRYQTEKALYDASRVNILLEEDIFETVSFIALNPAVGYGILRVMELNERPGQRDIVLYESLPNEMPRVGGIITTVPQTPLSHVNLRAIQDGVPNAYILGALENEEISSLIGKPVYYKVDGTGYEIREASLAELDAHYAALRPVRSQTPIRDLSITDITPLEDLDFASSSSFGAKAANVATMRSFGFPDGTIPDGYAIPFYFYDEFMKHNGFYEEAQAMLDDAEFQSDFDLQDERLSEFRDTIRDGAMPGWMLDALGRMQYSFPEGQPIRCRSSTNNEDLPGFSGAGLYTSKTQYPEEGHIEKSIKQVYASMWTFRAFDEREFYRIDHFEAAMGVLIHPNFEDEQANGVGVSLDPIYGTTGTFYLNTQIGEDLVTNPDALSIPEEVLLDAEGAFGYSVVRPSNQVVDGALVMSEAHLEELRGYLARIHEEFGVLYGVAGEEGFAMEIEYKVTAGGQLSIKQARPWSSFWAEQVSNEPGPAGPDVAALSMTSYPNPFSGASSLRFVLPEPGDVELTVFNALGQEVRSSGWEALGAGAHVRSLDGSGMSSGVYLVRLVVRDGGPGGVVTRKVVVL